jgi:hypothetical protein
MSLEDTNLDDTPLEYKPKTVSFPQISDEMVASVALGLEDELIVAARHGLSIEDYNELAAQPWFQLQVQVKRSEYEKNGVTFKAKAAWMAGELLDQVYVTAASGDASLNQKHEVLKTLIKAAGLEPKEEKIKDTGPGFSISIDLGGGQSISLSNQQTLTPVTLDAEVKEIKNA